MVVFIRAAAIILLAAFSGPLGYTVTLIAFVSPFELGGSRTGFAIQLIGTAIAVSLAFSFAVFALRAPVLHIVLLARKRGPVRSVSKFWRRLTLIDGAWLLTLPACWLGFALARPAREIHARLLSLAAARGDTVVVAVERYHSIHRQYPPALGDLVPQYIAQIPSTGMLAYRDFDYTSPAAGNQHVPYEIFVMMPLGLNGDMLVYWPGGKYQKNSTVEALSKSVGGHISWSETSAPADPGASVVWASHRACMRHG